jgi:diguanylate cyclase (GGDEF)-like protein
MFLHLAPSDEFSGEYSGGCDDGGANSLPSGIRTSDVAARLGGDEFAILVVLTGTEAAAKLAREPADCISLPYPIDQLTIEISASIGVAAYPDSGTNSEEPLHSADEAMYKAKSGRKRRQTVRRRELSTQAV